MSVSRYERLLRWYPARWRARYGEELVALLEDTYGEREIPSRDRRSILWAALTERLRELGFGNSRTPPDQVRAGSLLVLWAWASFVIAGAAFAKTAEHWDVATPRGQRWLPAAAYGAVQAAAGIGALLVLAGATLAVPSFMRAVRGGGWTTMRSAVLWAAGVSLIALMFGVGVSLWAHDIGSAQRNGGSRAYGLIGPIGLALVIAGIYSCTFGAAQVTKQVQLSSRILRAEGALALGVTSAMVVIVGGTLAWWGAVATSSPRFLAARGAGLFGMPGSPTMAVTCLVMLAGLGIGMAGAMCVARAITRMLPS